MRNDCSSESEGGCYGGEGHEFASSALCNGCPGWPGSGRDANNTSYLSKTDQKKHRDKIKSQREMDEFMENQGQASEQDESYGMVPFPFLYGSPGDCDFPYCNRCRTEGGSSCYLYVGAIVPAALLLLRQALDFTYKEELIMNTLSDYVEQVRIWTEETPAAGKPDEASREEIVEHIAESIRQTAAAGSHFSRMLTPEEEEIMREIIREFMD